MTDQPTLPDVSDIPATAAPIATPTPARQPKSTWLLAHLIRSGHVTETGAARAARIRTCATCSNAVLVGLDGDICAFEVTTDPQPLTAVGEALAQVEGRYTWSLRREGGRYVLDPRAAHDITHAPAGSRTRLDVVREHRCHTPAPLGQLVTGSSFPETQPPQPADAQPTF